jgi:hypothetical protein
MGTKTSTRLGIINCLLLLLTIGHAQPLNRAKKELTAVRISSPPVIDANLNDESWAEAYVAGNFLQYTPFNGSQPSFPSAVRIVYDDNAIYVGAMLYDPHPDSIYQELSERDRINMVDYFGIYLDCYNDYLTAFGFFVTAAGVQVDGKRTESNGEDRSWDAVWKSAVSIVDSGWIVEMEIPFSAIRFPDEAVQTWGLQIYRNITRYRESTTWNFIDREEDGINNQSGLLTGIRNIDPPLRLSFVPYISGYAEKSPETRNWGYSYNYGLDVKYGINESYTLDMTLIPDFGQVQSDDEIYNLSPFEVYYDEKRPFFMEGTELFDKGGVFYSRRVGKTPMGFYQVSDSLHDHEVIDDNPQHAQLINATKISGKNNKKLAMGFFNGMTANTYAEIKDTLTGKKRTIRTEPFTNYNMIVFDQALRNNSYLSLYNTNTWQPDHKYTANVTGSELKLTNKRNRYAIWLQGLVSQKYNAEWQPEFGYSYALEVGKISGNFTWELSHRMLDDQYDHNDMGFLTRNNFIQEEIEFSYNIYQPVGLILDWFNSISFAYEQLYNPRQFTEFEMDLSSRATFKNHLSVWLNGTVKPVEGYDYYEPRVAGWYYTRNPVYYGSLGISPDYRHRFVVDGRIGYLNIPKDNRSNYWFSIKPRFRASDNLMIVYEFSFDDDDNNLGYVTDSISASQKEVIIFGNRMINTYENVLEANYRFSNKSSVSLRARHYWITIDHTDYFQLQPDGSLGATDYNAINEFSLNIFNIDMAYVWNFAPGSELRVVWKNAIDTYYEKEWVDKNMEDIEKDFAKNFWNTISTPATNSFSVKVLYYIDYQQVKGLFRKN